MVVEDSKPIVRDIIKKIKSVNREITVDTAYDGESALNMLETMKPDILFTDIKLPLMDGLTLIQKAKSIYPSLKCVIISGYGDFEFTHKALKLQVDEYILKPVDLEIFRKNLTELICEINQNTIIKQEQLISNILNRKKTDREDVELPKHYALLVIRSGIIPKYSEMLTKDDIYKLLGIPASDGSVWVVDTKFDGEKVILYDLSRYSEKEIRGQSETVFQILNKARLQLNIMCSDKLSDIDHLYTQYMVLSNSLSSTVVLEQPGIYNSSASYSNFSLAKLNEEAAILRKRMESSVRNNLSGDFHTELNRNIRAWEQNHYPVIFVRRFLLIILDETLSSLGNNDQLLLEDPNSQVDIILSDCNSYRDLEAKLFEYYDILINAGNEKSGSPKELVGKIEIYLRNNIYGNLTMQNISDEFKLSPSYISRLMKMYYNVSPMDYYNKLKIEEAKKLITEHHEMLVKDIAEILGFSDQHYFSKVFKMRYGLSPMDIKNKTV